MPTESERPPETFDEAITRMARNAIIKIIQKGDWLGVNYSDRVTVDVSFLRRCYAAVDMERVRSLVSASIEEKIADHILNNMATEIGTDVKSILSNKELREDIRATVRAKIRESGAALKGGS